MSELKERVVHDEMEDRLYIAHEQDISSLVEQNRAQYQARDKHARWNDFERVASIPAVVVIDWMKEGINVLAPTPEDKKKIRRKLNSPEYAYLRTRGGRL